MPLYLKGLHQLHRDPSIFAESSHSQIEATPKAGCISATEQSTDSPLPPPDRVWYKLTWFNPGSLKRWALLTQLCHFFSFNWTFSPWRIAAGDIFTTVPSPSWPQTSSLAHSWWKIIWIAIWNVKKWVLRLCSVNFTIMPSLELHGHHDLTPYCLLLSNWSLLYFDPQSTDNLWCSRGTGLWLAFEKWVFFTVFCHTKDVTFLADSNNMTSSALLQTAYVRKFGWGHRRDTMHNWTRCNDCCGSFGW